MYPLSNNSNNMESLYKALNKIFGHIEEEEPPLPVNNHLQDSDNEMDAFHSSESVTYPLFNNLEDLDDYFCIQFHTELFAPGGALGEIGKAKEQQNKFIALETRIAQCESEASKKEADASWLEKEAAKKEALFKSYRVQAAAQQDVLSETSLLLTEIHNLTTEAELAREEARNIRDLTRYEIENYFAEKYRRKLTVHDDFDKTAATVSEDAELTVAYEEDGETYYRLV